MRGLFGEETPQIGRANIPQRRDALVSQVLQAGAGVALIGFACRVRQAALDAAVDQEVRQRVQTSLLRFPATRAISI